MTFIKFTKKELIQDQFFFGELLKTLLNKENTMSGLENIFDKNKKWPENIYTK